MHYFLLCSVAQLCPTLCDPMDCSLPGSSVRGTLQAEYWSGLSFPSPLFFYKHSQKCTKHPEDTTLQKNKSFDLNQCPIRVYMI